MMINPPETRSGDLRKDAGLAAVKNLGVNTVNSLPIWINIAALKLSMDNLIVHQVTPGVSGMVDVTDLRSIPSETPKLLEKSWLIESKKPEIPLFDSTSALGGYKIDASIGIIGMDYPDGIRFTLWTPKWGGGEISQIGDFTPILDVDPVYYNWAMHAVRYVLVLSLMLEADKSPALIDAGSKSTKKKLSKTGSRKNPWVVRRIHLMRTASYKHDGERSGSSIKEGKVQETVFVRGHLKRQVVGKGRKERKWIWISSYDSRRWIIPGPRKIVVDL